MRCTLTFGPAAVLLHIISTRIASPARLPPVGRRLGGGWGGRAHEDGENATVSMCQGDVQNAPVELQELYYPVLIERQQLREGSGGAGKFRGDGDSRIDRRHAGRR